MNYCLNNSNKISNQNDLNLKENHFDKRCANYDNLSYLTKKTDKIKKNSSCKDYFINTKTLFLNENKTRK